MLPYCAKKFWASEKKFSGFLQTILYPSLNDNHQKNIRGEEKQSSHILSFYSYKPTHNTSPDASQMVPFALSF